MVRVRGVSLGCVLLLCAASAGQPAKKAPAKGSASAPTPASVFGFEPGRTITWPITSRSRNIFSSWRRRCRSA